jgi:hypothetical protein
MHRISSSGPIAFVAVIACSGVVCSCGSGGRANASDAGTFGDTVASEDAGTLGADTGLDGEAGTGPDASCFIEPSQYDQSCLVDSDCIEFISGVAPYLGLGGLPVVAGNYCASMCLCRSRTISRSAATQYWTDVSHTPLGSGSISAEACGCAMSPPACCQNGKCTTAACRNQTDDSGTGASDAGAPPDGSVLCGLHEGPLEGGASIGDPSRWCYPMEQWVPFNGGWACCVTNPLGGVSTCAVPVANDAGG